MATNHPLRHSASSMTFTDGRPVTGQTKSFKKLRPGTGDTKNSRGRPTTGESRKSEALGPIIVDWDGPDDPENPLNWSKKRKWAATIIVSLFTFISPVASSMVAPAVDQVGRDIGISNTVLLSMAVSIFVLAYALGPLVFGPLSEIFGRVRILQVGNIWFSAFNLGTGFSQTPLQFIILRFLSGIGGSPPLAVGGGVLGDIWRPAERGKAFATYALAPLLGPSLAPVFGGLVAEFSNWRWVFRATTIAAVLVQIAGLFFLQETYAPFLLERKAKKIRKEFGAASNDHAVATTVFAKGKKPQWGPLMRRSLIRPFAIFFKEPIVLVLGAYMAFVYGLTYLCLTSIPDIFRTIYQQKVDIASLHYIALGLGLFTGSQFNARYMDRLYKYLGEREGRHKPEHRLPMMFPGSIALPTGLLIFGWTAEYHVFWLVPDIGLFIIGPGIILAFQVIQVFVIDMYKTKAASALAAVNFMRSLAGFGFPLFAPSMYKALGYGKGNTVLAACAIALGGPAPVLFWFYGEKLRNMSSHAHKHEAEVTGEKKPPSVEVQREKEEEHVRSGSQVQAEAGIDNESILHVRISASDRGDEEEVITRSRKEMVY